MNGLYALKPWYTRRLSVFVDVAVRRRMSPDVFTALGLAAGLVGGAAIACGWWPLAAIALAARLAGANLDGAIARSRQVSRPWGFVLNELGDRGSDLLMFAGLVALAVRYDGWSATTALVLVSATAATLPTFASLAAAGAGAGRRNGGPFGKTERCLAAVVAAAVPAHLAAVAALAIAGSVVTAGVRLRATYAELSANAQETAA